MLTATILVITGHFTPVATTFFTSKIELLPFVIVSSNVPTTLQQDATVNYQTNTGNTVLKCFIYKYIHKNVLATYHKTHLKRKQKQNMTCALQFVIPLATFIQYILNTICHVQGVSVLTKPPDPVIK